ncbi:type IVB secretion system protein IcmH/DotU [Luteimonas sp. XNQY3]|nr:type IVB secretion system protein IcmH/DotU [Luteimonas sp. XNQY3]MCD9007353.1 type IVB secretion system protein IcmH/DotU [Luteimonas sp. XNQY3]
MSTWPQDPPADATIVRPRQPDALPPHPADSLLPPPAPSPEEISAFLGRGRNPLLHAASPLLLLAVQLRHSSSAGDAEALRAQVQAQVRRFEARLAESGVSQQTVTAARYVLCATLDEAVLNSPWGERSGWASRTLLVTFHGESYGGARFFQLLDQLLQDVPRHIDLLELMYACLALGFSGRFQIEAGGRARLADIQDDLQRRIRAQRGPPAEGLSPHWRGVEQRGDPLARRLAPWLVPGIAGCVLLGAFAWFHARLNELAAPIGAEAARIGLAAVAPPGDLPRPPPVRTLAQLLANEAQAGLLEIDQRGDGQARVRLAAGTMFDSGGDALGDDAHALVGRVGKALEQLPGRVLVVGHTDDQPLRSLRFKDNYALSTARAQAVADVLSASLTDAGRLEVVGAGASQPLAQPASRPENRARNRRVEILYQPGD